MNKKIKFKHIVYGMIILILIMLFMKIYIDDASFKLPGPNVGNFLNAVDKTNVIGQYSFWRENRIVREHFRIDLEDEGYSIFQGIVTNEHCNTEFDYRERYNNLKYVLSYREEPFSNTPPRQCWIRSGETDNYINCECFYATSVND